jgi:hypothetical protein
MSTFKQFVDLCLFQTQPQDLPASKNLTILAVLAAILANTLTHQTLMPAGQSFLTAALQVGVFAASILIALRLRHVSERAPQSLTAILGSGALLQLVAWPVSAWLVRARGGAGAELPFLLLIALSVWMFAIVVYVLRHALDVRTPTSILIALLCQVATLLVVLPFLPDMPTPQ